MAVAVETLDRTSHSRWSGNIFSQLATGASVPELECSTGQGTSQERTIRNRKVGGAIHMRGKST